MIADDNASLAAEVQDLAERLAAYQDAVADVTRSLGHAGDGPEDLHDAVGQIVDRLLRGQDLDAPLTGAAEQIRAMLIYAHLGAWVVQGVTRQPIVGRVAHPALVMLLNSKPSAERLFSLAANADDPDVGVWLSLLRECIELFDRSKPCDD